MSMNEFAQLCIVTSIVVLVLALIFALIVCGEAYPLQTTATLIVLAIIGLSWGVWYLNADHSPRQPKATPMTQPIQPEQ